MGTWNTPETPRLQGAVTPLQDAVSAGSAWLVRVTNPGTAPALWPADLQAYYKLPLAFVTAGFPDLASQWLSHTYEKFYNSTGHFTETNPTLPYLTHCYMYRDYWLAQAGVMLNSWLGYAVANNILAMQTAGGGFLCTPEDTTRLGLLATAVGGLTALSINRQSSAVRAADFIVDCFSIQPDLARMFYLQRYSSGHLITDIPNEYQSWVVFTPEQKRPLLYVFGLCSAVLSHTAEVTRQERFILAAEDYYSYYTRICGPGAVRNPYSGKMGWAATLLYRLTGKQEYAAYALDIASYLVERQQDDGSWFLSEFKDNTSVSSFALTVDRTAEFVTWLTLISQNLKIDHL